MKVISFTPTMSDYILNGIDVTQAEREKIINLIDKNIKTYTINTNEVLPTRPSEHSINIFNYLRDNKNKYFINKEKANEIVTKLNLKDPFLLNEYNTENEISTIVDRRPLDYETYWLDEYGIWCTIYENQDEIIYNVYERTTNTIVASVNIVKKHNSITYFYKGVAFRSYRDFLESVLENTLTNEDIVFFDWFNTPNQTILKSCKKAKTIGMLHSNFQANKSKILPMDLDKNYITNQQLFNSDFDNIAVATYNQQLALESILNKNNIITLPPKTDFSDRLKSVTDNELVEFKKNRFVTVSSLVPGKNLLELVHFISFFNQSYAPLNNLEPIYLDIFGLGPQAQELEQAILNSGMEDYIFLRGALPYENIDFIKYYEAYLSVSISESYGLTLLEALNANLPIVALDVPVGNREFIQDNKHGYLVPVNDDNYFFDYEDYAKGIEYIRENNKKIKDNIYTLLNTTYKSDVAYKCYKKLIEGAN